MKLTLDHRHAETAEIESFLFKPESPIDFIPGQFLKWRIDDPHPDNRGNQRFFTISASPTEPFIMLSTRFNPQSSSFKQHLKAMKPGDTIEVGPPSGEFTIDSDPQDSLIFVAGGIGITPYRSMLKFMHDADLFVPVHLIYATRGPADVAFRDLFFELENKHGNLKVTYVFEEPAEFPKDYHTGRLTGQMIADLSDGLGVKEVYLSGPEPMVEALEAQLLKLGHPEDLIKGDYFPGYTGI